MRLFLSETFFDAVFKLPKKTQDKVVTFQKKFRENPASPGIHLEPITQFKNSTMRTARVDDNYRVVIGVLDGNTYSLLYVADHEEAYRWGMSKRFVWNEHTQACQLISVEEKEQDFTPTTQTVTESTFFTGVPEEKLLKIGIPQEAIGRVISIVSGKLKEKPLVVVSALAKVTRLLCMLAEEAEAQHEDGVKDLLRQLRERHFNLARNLLAERPNLLENCLQDVERLISDLETFVGGVCMIGELSPRSEARIISTGELLSSTIIAYAFNANGITCHWIDARRMITTDDHYLYARPDLEVTEANIKRIVGLESRGADLILTQGFVASTDKGVTSVLGFEGSDYSAAIFGMALDAERVEIWTDVDGIRTADPRVISHTGKIDVVSYEEAAEMAAMGARVLHPLTIEPARKKNIPIKVLNSTNPECEGTMVVRSDQAPDGPKSIAFRDGILFVKVTSDKLEGVTSMLGKVFATLYPRRIPVTLSGATESEVCLVIPEEVGGFKEAVEELASWASVTVFRDKALVSVVGRGIVGFEGIGDKVIEVSGKVHMAIMSANMMSESFVVDHDKLQATLESLHEYVFKEGGK